MIMNGSNAILLVDNDPFREIYRIFSLTKYGQKLSREVRYSRYQPVHVSNDKWVELLGWDVNNLLHHLEAYAITKSFVIQSGNLFSEHERIMLYITAVIHDFAEAVRGDKMFDMKTAVDEREELKCLSYILKELFDGHSNGGIEFRHIEEAYQEVMSGRNPKLRQAFNAIERVGYLTTGCRAWMVEKEIEDDGLKYGLLWLTHNVLFNQIPKLLEYSDSYFSVRSFLKVKASLISEAFMGMEDLIFDYEPEELVRNSTRFADAKRSWFSTRL